jgi:hypothetical protein
MKLDQVKQLKWVQKENAQLKKLVANLSLAQLSQLGGQIAISKIFFPHNASIMPQMVSNPAW